MFVVDISKDFDDFSNSTHITGDKSDDINIIIILLLLTILGGVILLSLIDLMTWTTLKPLIYTLSGCFDTQF